MAHSQSVAIACFVGVGSRDEPSELAGAFEAVLRTPAGSFGDAPNRERGAWTALRLAGVPRVRFPTKNSEHQAAFRGKAIFLGHWGRACAEAALLTPGLIASRTRSQPQTRALMALLRRPAFPPW